MATVAREPRAYEFMTILLPDLADEDLTSQIERLTSYFTAAGGTVKDALTDSPWGRRRLAYTVRFSGSDYRDGIYVLFHVDLEPSRVAEVERELKFDVRVMRYLVVHDDPRAGEKTIPGQELPEGDAEVSDTRPTTESAVVTAPRIADTSATGDEPSVPEPAAEPVTADEPAPADEPVVETSASVDVSAPVDEPAQAVPDEPAEETPTVTDTPNADDVSTTDKAPAEETKES